MTRYARAANVGMVVEDGDDDRLVVYLAPLPDGPIHVLNGVASLIWLEAIEPARSGDLVDRVAALVTEEPAAIRADVEAFLADLVEAGLLEGRDG